MLLFFFPCHVRAAKRPCISAKRALYLRARGLIHCTKYPLPCIAVEYTKVHRNGARAPPCVTWELPPKTPVPLHKKPCISANEACIYLCKRTLYLCKRGLYLRKRAMHLCKKSNVSLQKEPCISAKEQCISAKRALYSAKRALYHYTKYPISWIAVDSAKFQQNWARAPPWVTWKLPKSLESRKKSPVSP